MQVLLGNTGHTFCRGCITNWLRYKKTNPMDRQQLTSEELVVNWSVRGQVAAYNARQVSTPYRMPRHVHLDTSYSSTQGQRLTPHLHGQGQHTSTCYHFCVRMARSLLAASACGTLHLCTGAFLVQDVRSTTPEPRSPSAASPSPRSTPGIATQQPSHQVSEDHTYGLLAH